MENCNNRQLGIALLLAIGMSAASVNDRFASAVPSSNIVAADRTLAQQMGVRIPAGTTLSVKYDVAQKILVAPNEPAPITLTLNLARNVISNSSSIIPAGSQIVGELVTMQDQETAQFVAKEIILTDGTRIPISASSKIIDRTEQISKKARLDRIVKNSALSTAAAAAVTAMSGNAAFTANGVILNSGFGSSSELVGAFRNQEKVNLISINPNRDLTLTLNSDLVL